MQRKLLMLLTHYYQLLMLLTHYYQHHHKLGTEKANNVAHPLHYQHHKLVQRKLTNWY